MSGARPVVRGAAAVPALLWALTGLSGVASAQAASQTLDGHAPIALEGEGPYHRLNLPLALYGRVADGDLSRLRIHNAQGQAVPWAWMEREAASPQTESAAVPIYAWPGRAATTATGPEPVFTLDGRGRLQLQGRTSPAAPVPPQGWLIDLRGVQGALLQMRVALDAQAQGFFPFTLQASHDLQRWRSVGGDGQLLRLQSPAPASGSAGESTVLERLSVDLQGVDARFLRLQWHDPQRAPQLQRVEVDSAQQAQAMRTPEWSGPIAPEACGATHCDYRMPPNLPLTSLRIQLAQPNTLAPVTVVGISEPAKTRAADTRSVGHVHNPLYALRRHSQWPAPASAQADEWPLFETVVYRIAQPDGEARSAELVMDGASWSRLRLQTRGPVSALGTPPPTLEVASPPRALVFLAQGSPPFELRWPEAAGAPPASGAPLPLATLMPGQDLSKPLAVGQARVQLEPRMLEAVTSAPPTKADAEGQTERKFWLWGALGVGLLLLAGMAWSLLRSVGTAAREER